MLVANIKIWKSHLNIREGSDYILLNHCALEEDTLPPAKYWLDLGKRPYMAEKFD